MGDWSSARKEMTAAAADAGEVGDATPLSAFGGSSGCMNSAMVEIGDCAERKES